MNLLAVAAFGIYWQLPILIVVISVVYSATRYDEWSEIIREACSWGFRMTSFLLGIAVILFLLAKWI